ncbi:MULTISPECIES: lytic transglycosylase domain-containing protein [unclassified Bartonella]|uniref:lytic transglycosylase domain-containing protein n=1 Tax=unclassified Bartonella TaxID=2645622 RepID=UPI00099A57F5|nr:MULTISPECIES: lytic transglycosylase domain-containing protein [unclassified Bartonella]AQX18577.1 soluble lytic murein transglycosylase [Bartonella sp. A1379B]AQX23091.1 soluble lytic murein transglycosylase [Bartonella sp. 11B]AQX23612.1 soluble lytic murein transglycosylase [Bartonella sp. 114]AQX25546.1 soluble lytic murein transglycosylase [Bartonella sp. Coyote22sub2]
MYIVSVHYFVSIFIILKLATIILLSNASAQTVFLPQNGPIPLVHPHSSITIEKLKKSFEANHPIKNNIPTKIKITKNNQLKFGLDTLSNKDIMKTIALRNTMPQNSLDRHILTWAINTSYQTNIPSSEILRAINELKGWPGMNIMKRNAERAFINENNSTQAIIQKFTHHSPLTVQGMAALAKALIVTGQTTRARQIIAPWWHTVQLNAQEEDLILKNASTALKPSDHLKRMKIMLYANRIDSAQRIAKLAHAQSLFNAFAAVEKNEPQAAQKLKAVDQSWKKDPLLQFAKIRYFRRTGQYETAAQLMMQAPRDPINLINPDAWWIERRVLSREMLDLNKPKIAYQLVSAHIGGTPSFKIDAAFHAGWYALRFLHSPKTAMHHFTHIPQLSSSPLSTSRGYYWMGRTAEALGEYKNAQHYFQRAAHFGTTYYGQLAASRLNEKKLEIYFPKPTMNERQSFSARKGVQVIQRLEAAGYANLAKIFYKELSTTIDNPGELALLAVMSEKSGDYYTSLKIGKTAVVQGKAVSALSHPIGAIPTSINFSATKKALIYAIARQESEFNPVAISKAGAQGMLQLLPTTAKALANKHSIAWSHKKFSSDVNYNTILGAHFLSEQLEHFNGSYILAFISYNAGFRRANEWIERYGDPRGQSLDNVVDWIERIPYTETRNYVMRVIENYEVYKARLIGTTDIKSDLIAGYRKS